MKLPINFFQTTMNFMNWFEKLDDSEKAWEEVMLRHAFDASEWEDADKVLVELSRVG